MQNLENSPRLPVLLAGSRSVTGPAFSWCSWLAAELVRLEFPIVTGCASGADAAFIAGALGVPGGASRLTVCAVGSRFGEGFPVRGVPPWVVPAVEAGAHLWWLAGGMPTSPLRVRLARRTRFAATLAELAAVLVFTSPDSRGTQLAGIAAARRGLPVFAFAWGFAPSRLPAIAPGSWAPAHLLDGIACWGWLPHAPLS